MNETLPVPAALWHLAGLFCHQLPERSPHLGAAVFPFCFRCTGLYVSAITTFVCLAVGGGWRRRLPDTRGAVWMSLLMVPLFIDGWANVIGLWSSSGQVRALTGAGVGLVLPLFLVPLAQPTGDREAGESEPLRSSGPALLPSAAVGLMLVWLVMHPVRPWLFQVLAVAASCAPVVCAATFGLAGWRSRGALSYTLGMASRPVA